MKSDHSCRYYNLYGIVQCALIAVTLAYVLADEPIGKGYDKNYDGYFQYANVPGHHEYEFGYKRGNPHHYTSRYEQAKDWRFRTKVKWADSYDGYGEQYYEYNHGHHHEPEKDYHHEPAKGYHSEPAPVFAAAPAQVWRVSRPAKNQHLQLLPFQKYLQDILSSDLNSCHLPRRKRLLVSRFLLLPETSSSCKTNFTLWFHSSCPRLSNSVFSFPRLVTVGFDYTH